MQTLRGPTVTSPFGPKRKSSLLVPMQVFHSTPRMQHATPLFDEREEAAAASWLIIDSINCQIRIVAKQKGADSAMTDEKHIACPILNQDAFDLTYDAQLGVDCPLPSLNA